MRSETMWYIVLGLVVLILFWRIVLPGMRLGVNGTTHTPSPAGSGTAASASPPSISIKKWSTSNWPSILLVIIGAVLIYWGFQNTQVGPADAGSWGRNHWVPLLILWSVGAALIALNAEMLKKAAGTLQWVLAGMMFMFFIGFPIIGWFGGSSSPKQEKQAADVAKIETSILTMPPGIGAKSKRIPVPFMHNIVMTGEDFRVNCLYGDGHVESYIPIKEPSCKDGDMPFVYATNLKEHEDNVVAYTYVDMRRQQ